MIVNQSVNTINLHRLGQIPDIQKNTCINMHININKLQGKVAMYTAIFFYLMAFLLLQETHHINKSSQDTDYIFAVKIVLVRKK